MALKDIWKISRKTFFDPLTWIDYDSLRRLNRILFSQIRDLFTVPKPTRTETFEQAMKRLGLEPEDVQDIETNYRFYTWLFLIIAAIIFLFSLYLLFHYVVFWGTLIGLTVAALALSQAFKYDFWVFQIQQRKLGCTFNEWKQARFGAKGKLS